MKKEPLFVALSNQKGGVGKINVNRVACQLFPLP